MSNNCFGCLTPKKLKLRLDQFLTAAVEQALLVLPPCIFGSTSLEPPGRMGQSSSITFFFIEEKYAHKLSSQPARYTTTYSAWAGSLPSTYLLYHNFRKNQILNLGVQHLNVKQGNYPLLMSSFRTEKILSGVYASPIHSSLIRSLSSKSISSRLSIYKLFGIP